MTSTPQLLAGGRHRGVVESRPPDERSRGLKGWLAGKYNRVRDMTARRSANHTDWEELAQVRRYAMAPTDINEHLERMFLETVLSRPELIVELGVRSGASTYVFERAARLCEAWLVSVDLEDCSRISTYPKWRFIQGDDVEVGSRFRDLCSGLGLRPGINTLFIDTSHYFDHTMEEIEAWFPYLSPTAKVIFHDTNLRTMGPRDDGRIQLSWDNSRGVIRAIERYFHIHVDERRVFSEYAAGFIIRHWPNCNGLTILDRLQTNPALSDSASR
jgi:cephalosporin hydroxylase